MNRLEFVKMVGSGNDFVLVDARHSSFVVPAFAKASADRRDSLSKLARVVCQRKIGAGADGLLVLERSKKADFRMRIFNADGSEPEMCGNGLRCAALYAYGNKCKGTQTHKKNLKVETKAGIYEANAAGKNKLKIKMENPEDLRLDISIRVNNRPIKVSYIDTGVPHTVIFVQGLEKIDVGSIGRDVRRNSRFKPRGTNVDFVEIVDDKNIKMRTYERGVEGETLACGTGAVASAIIANYGRRTTNHKIAVHTRGGILEVYFRKIAGRINDVYLQGEATEVYTGAMGF